MSYVWRIFVCFLPVFVYLFSGIAYSYQDNLTQAAGIPYYIIATSTAGELSADYHFVQLRSNAQIENACRDNVSGGARFMVDQDDYLIMQQVLTAYKDQAVINFFYTKLDDAISAPGHATTRCKIISTWMPKP